MHLLRRWKLLGLVAAVALLSAGCIGFEVTKRVIGESDGPFTVHIECVNDNGTFSDDLTLDNFDENGEQTLQSDEFPADDEGPTSCTVTEPEQAGALNVHFACGELPEGVNCISSAVGLVVTFPEGSSPGDFPDVPVIITNNFVEEAPPVEEPSDTGAEAPASAVTAQPTSTG